MSALDDFYLQQEEPTRSCLLALRTIILKQDADISNSLKYGMPFFLIKEKCFAMYGSIKNTNNLTLAL